MPSDVIDVVEILGKSEQGFQEPFQCIGADGSLYYVKGRQTDRASLCNEWICAHLGQHLGLPIPPFGLLRVPEEIIAEAPTEWRRLGAGIAFGSKQHAGCTWFSLDQAKHVSIELQTKILAFDWWIQNTDRTEWNPNLLWDAEHGELVVIDHNLTFPAIFNTKEFLEEHVFRERWDGLDLIEFDNLQGLFCATADAILDQACDNVPSEWSWMNIECDIPSNMNLDSVRSTILRCKSADFWRFR